MTVIEHEAPRVSDGILDRQLSQVSLEAGLYALVGLAALALRFFQIGDVPLSTAEAHEALTVWRHVSLASFSAAPPASPALAGLMAIVFWLFGASEFWARLWPALTGLVLVLWPITMRKYLGRGGALLASCFLAISPTMLAVSRQADGTTLSGLALLLIVSGFQLALAERDRRSWLLAGLGLGLGLASGAHFYSAAAAGVVALVLVALLSPRTIRRLRSNLANMAWLPMLLTACATFILAASGSFLFPAGFSAAGGGLLAWLRGWMPNASGRQIWIVPFTLMIHEPLLVIMGLAGFYWAFLSEFTETFVARVKIVFTAKDDAELDAPPVLNRRKTPVVDVLLATLALGATLYGIIYTGRAAEDGVWIVIPLALLSGKLLADVFGGDWFSGEWETVVAQAGVLFVMLVFVYFHLGGYARSNPLFADRPIELRLYLAGAVLALGVFVTVMFALGWTTLSAVRGAAMAVGLATLIATLGSGIALTTWRSDSPNELWSLEPTQRHITLMMQTVRNVSQWTAGTDRDLEIAVVADPASGDQDGLLGWELRNYPRARFVDSVDSAVGAPLIIADAAVADPRLISGYAGEQFPILGAQAQSDSSGAVLVNWWLYRQWPTQYSRTITVWVRQDVHSLVKKTQ